MPGEKSNDKPSLPAVALELFKSRSQHYGVNARQLAINCFREARTFLAVADEFSAGLLDQTPDDASPLDVAFAPNLKKTHPINLMSRAWGDLSKVKSVMAELDANPAAEFYEPYGWGKPEVNQARSLFPSVINRSQQLATAK